MSETGNGSADQQRPSASEAELVADLKPTGALEHMKIQQMARAHDTTLACFDRAEVGEPAAREVELRLAARFMILFMQQAGALDRRRGALDAAAAKTGTLTRDCTRTAAMTGEKDCFLEHVAEPFAEARDAAVAAVPGAAAAGPSTAAPGSRQQRQERKAPRPVLGRATELLGAVKDLVAKGVDQNDPHFVGHLSLQLGGFSVEINGRPVGAGRGAGQTKILAKPFDDGLRGFDDVLEVDNADLRRVEVPAPVLVDHGRKRSAPHPATLHEADDLVGQGGPPEGGHGIRDGIFEAVGLDGDHSALPHIE